MSNDRNNSWDAIWQDAGKGLMALMVPIGIFLLFVLSWKAILIVLLVLLLLWVFVLA